MYNVDTDLSNKYGVQGSPTLIINGVKSNAGRASASYLAGICAAFNEAPEECNTLELLGEPLAPGFGWGETGPNTEAQCA